MDHERAEELFSQEMAVCIYHDLRHFWEVPLFLKELVPEYKIYIRHHTLCDYETVCYALM